MEEAYFPIKNITTYTTNWTILGRIVDKSPLKPLKGDNFILSIDIVDKNGDIIRSKFWGKAATKWDEILQKGQVYKFSRGTVNLSNKRFNSIPHNYELTFNQDSLIELTEDNGDINSERAYQFVSLRDIKSSPSETPFTVDLLCIIRSIGPLTKINTRDGREISRRVLCIVDDSNYELELTLWDQFAELGFLCDADGKPLLASQISIKDWQGGRSAQTNIGSVIKLATGENIRDTNRLVDLISWFEQASTQQDGFKSMKAQTTQNRNDVAEATTVGNISGKIKGSFVFVCKLRKVFWRNKDGIFKLWYLACPMCNKKVVVDETSGSYRCFSCDDAVVIPALRYLFSCVFIDYTGEVIAQIHGGQGDKLLGMSASELDGLDRDKFKALLDYQITHKDYKVTGYIRSRMYNGDTKYHFNVSNIQSVNYLDEIRLMLDEMQIGYRNVAQFLGVPNDPNEEEDDEDVGAQVQIKRSKTDEN